MPKKVLEPEAPAKAVGVSAKPDTARLVRLCAAAWLIPGAGHYMLGRRVRALILFLAIVATFAFGLAMKGQFFSVHSPSYLESLGWFGEFAVGLAMPLASFFGYGGGDPFFVSADFGTAFLVAAGMLNVLSILDAYDIALGRKP
jgi:hypothetical protein